MKRVFLCFILVPILLVFGCGDSDTGTNSPTIVNEATMTPTPTSTAPLIFSPTAKPPIQTDRVKPTLPVKEQTPTPVVSTATPAPLEVQKVLNLGIMVHLEGWDDGVDETKFRDHAALLREYATLFEKYGAELTFESKEVTEGCINWDDNVLLEMQDRGHAVGIHADIGTGKIDTLAKMEFELMKMRSDLESLDIEVRHISGISSQLDWVTAAANTGFEYVTGTVAYALLSLPPEERPITIPDDARPAEYHEAYPFTLEGRLSPWRAENGSNWIYDSPTGDIVIMPSGSGLAYTYEESLGDSGLAGDQHFTVEDIVASEQLLNDILTYIESNESTQPYAYYFGWSLGKSFDQGLLEQWLQMVDKYVESGQVQWKTITEMYDDYVEWEIDSGRRN